MLWLIYMKNDIWSPIKVKVRTDIEYKWLFWLFLAVFFKKMANSENTRRNSGMEIYLTQIEAENIIFIEKLKSYIMKFKIWLIVADFQRIQEKWLIQKIGEGIE